LFSFDFAQILSLSPEIGMTDELLMIVRQSPPEPGALLRRSVMSGYDRRQGFFRIADLDERTQPAKVPNRPTDLARPEADSPGRNVDQEFFIVNFETNALLGRKRPVRVVPLETWDNASFRAAYTVESRVVDFGMTELIMSDAVSGLIPGEELGREDFGLGEREWEVYTDYGDDPRIRELALELTDGSESLYEKVLDIYGYLKFGDFRYSLRPGISGDGDQLAYFLFDARRGYCTYFAFSMTLMLRSLGIPARVAAGFFADPDSAVFDYHAIRADMAHAWVEVLFPGQDWVEFDPTTANLAEDEEFNFSSGTDPDLLERLMREILENRGNLRARFGAEEAESVNPAAALARAGIAALRKLALPIGIACLALLFLAIRCGPFMESRFRKAGRAKALALYRHALRRMRLAGLGCPGRRPQSEWAAGTEARIPGIYGLYLAASAARFAPTYAEEDFLALQADYGRFGLSYAKAVSPGRRLLAWLLPPLALILPAKSPLLPPLLALVLICLTASGSGKAQETPEEGVPRDAVGLFRDALSAEYAENWDRAITLYKEGSASFPDDVRFPLALGNLYYRKSLYGLAWDEFSRTLAIDPFHAGALQSKANTAGLLNRDREAVILLRRLLEIEPENLQAISNLGWMYFKVHRLTDGERLLVAAIEQFGVNQDLAMALGTVYSEMFRYEESRYWYRTAIDLSASSRSFLAVAHYNLSILESRFYRYDLALREANASLTAMRRSSGFLVRGELLMRQMDLSGATADFASAQDVDTTPLSRLSLATLHLASGRLTEALLNAESALRAADTSWMANYGISPDRYYADVHEALTEIHSSLAEAGRFLPDRTPKDRFDRGLARLRHRFYASVHRHLFGKYALAASRAYDRVAAAKPAAEEEAPPISRFLQLFGAFKAYPNRAVLYLNRARHFETAIIPAAASAYDLERALLGTETALALAALEGFDPIWQRDLAASAYG
ncbi:MAG: hypothetical protein FWD94_08495, partial [Treponema sp.]|nr:hypothetical protein [Treponema sp.]